MVVIWSKFADDALVNIYRFYQWSNVMKARKIVQNVRTHVKQLGLFPFSGHAEPLLSGASMAYRAVVVMKQFKVIHFVNEHAGEVVIVDVWDCRQDPAYLQNRVRLFDLLSLN